MFGMVQKRCCTAVLGNEFTEILAATFVCDFGMFCAQIAAVCDHLVSIQTCICIHGCLKIGVAQNALQDFGRDAAVGGDGGVGMTQLMRSKAFFQTMSGQFILNGFPEEIVLSFGKR